MTGRFSSVIITGGHGDLGEAVVEAARAAGMRVCLLTRDPKPNRPGIREIAWRLGESLPCECLDTDSAPGEQALIHLAHDWSDTDDKAGVNLMGARVLRDSARAAGLGRLIFISSQSARADALNVYGRVKWASNSSSMHKTKLRCASGLSTADRGRRNMDFFQSSR